MSVNNVNIAKANNPKEEDADLPENFAPILDADKSIVTYSNSITITLTNMCHNKCKYCDFPDTQGPLTVPYHTIKCFKQARIRKAREANIVSGERPDTNNLIRAKLNTWGFDSYADYVYTICELAFLEGLLPHLNVGYLTPREIKTLREIVVSMEMNIETTNRSLLNSIHKNSPGKDPNIRAKFVENCGKLSVPVTTGIRVGMGESAKDREDAIKLINSINNEHGHIQDVVLHNFIPKKALSGQLQEVSKETMLETVKMARSILPESVRIRVPIILNMPNIIEFIQAGVSDLGEIQPGEVSSMFPDRSYPQIDELSTLLDQNGYMLDRRLPIYHDFILNQKYSKKLAQLLDKYRYKINLVITEKQKEEEERAAAEAAAAEA